MPTFMRRSIFHHLKATGFELRNTGLRLLARLLPLAESARQAGCVVADDGLPPGLARLLRLALARLQAAGRPRRILDIAAGHGRYVLEALEGAPCQPDAILLRDFSDINVRDGRALIDRKGLGGIAHFEKGDAFDPASIASVRPQPTIGIVSGLYELFPENAVVQRSLAGLADAIEPGGYLIYTGQPWHPQLELIARALTSHRGGQAWVMRRRTQAEMDQLVEAAGFEKIEQRIDECGIFTVSLVRRKA